MTATLKGAWNYPTRVLAGPGRIAELADACATAGIKRPLFVTDKGLAQSEITARAMAVLKAAGLNPGFYADVRSNPVEANLDDGLTVYKAGNHDGVVAFGGGSALDIAKLIAFMSGQTRPVWDYEDVGDWWTRADPAGIAPIVAVPTTAGTGSEVGRAAVITNAASQEKKIIFHPKMLPVVVISDPELTVGLPPHITAWTGIDAFTHCFEAYSAPGFHPIADGIAVEGMRLIKEYLPRAVARGDDIEARANMLAAASMGAAAFQKGLGATHSIAHPLGVLYDTHHGLANAVILPYVMVFNRPAIEDRMPHLARVLNLETATFDAVLAYVLSLRKALGVPHSLAEIKVPADRAAEIGVMAEHDPSTGSNPRVAKAADMERIFRAAQSGNLAAAAG
jgi:hypothetical protein